MFVEIVDKIEVISKQLHNASKAQKIRFASISLESMHEHIGELFKMDIWKSDGEAMERKSL